MPSSQFYATRYATISAQKAALIRALDDIMVDEYATIVSNFRKLFGNVLMPQENIFSIRCTLILVRIILNI